MFMQIGLLVVLFVLVVYGLGKTIEELMDETDPNGFTLIELLLVMAIIGILAVVAIPQYATLKENSRNTHALSDIRNIKEILEVYWSDNGRYPIESTAVSAGNDTGGDTLSIDSTNAMTQKLTNGVYCSYISDGNGVDYALTCKSKPGNRLFGTTSGLGGLEYFTAGVDPGDDGTGTAMPSVGETTISTNYTGL